MTPSARRRPRRGAISSIDGYDGEDETSKHGRILPILAVAGFLAGILGAPSSYGDTDPVPAPDAGQPGARLYAERCAQCHDHPADRIPARAFLTVVKTPEQVVTALTEGVMQPQAAGLDPSQIRALATFITGKAPGATHDPDPAANKCPAKAEPIKFGVGGEPVPGDWSGWGHDPGNTRSQQKPGFTAADLPRLKVKWVFAYPGNVADGQPVVVGRQLFIANRAGRVFALDAVTGCTFWTFKAEGGVHAAVAVGPRGGGAAAYVATENGIVHALDAQSGAPLWAVRVEDHPSTRLTGSPTLYRGRLYVPLASLEEVALFNKDYVCCTFRGGLAAIEVDTGRMLWKSHTIEQEPAQIGLTTSSGKLFGPAGAAVFSAPTIDPARKTVYVGTGNSYTQASTDGANAVMAFDLETGARRWSTQVAPDDDICPKAEDPAACRHTGPDFDFAAPPLLRRLPDGRDILVAMSKADEIYGFDPDDKGKLIWREKLGKGSRVAGVWGLAAEGATVYAGSADVRPGAGVAVGGLTAVDAATGKLTWQTPAPPAECSWGDAPNALAAANGAVSCSAAQPAAVAITPDVVFSGSIDGHMRAFSRATGARIWDFDTAQPFKAINGATAIGGSISNGAEALAGGMLYVNSGSAGVHQPGNALIAFSIDGQ